MAEEPLNIAFDLTQRCNNDCVYCLGKVAGENLSKVKDIDLTPKVLQNLAAIMPNSEAILSGSKGEPTLHPKFFEIVSSIAKLRPKNIQLFTNMQFCTTSERTSEFLKRLKEAAGGINIDIYASVGDMHAQVTPGMQYGRKAEAQKLIDKLRAKVEILHEQAMKHRIAHKFLVKTYLGDERFYPPEGPANYRKYLRDYGIPMSPFGVYGGYVNQDYSSLERMKNLDKRHGSPGAGRDYYIRTDLKVHGDYHVLLQDHIIGNIGEEPLLSMHQRLLSTQKRNEK